MLIVSFAFLSRPEAVKVKSQDPVPDKKSVPAKVINTIYTMLFQSSINCSVYMGLGSGNTAIIFYDSQ